MPVLDTGGTRLHYRIAGSGPAVVLLHGGMCSSADWEHQLRALADRHTVVAPDLRGHGQSTGDAARFTVAQCAADLAALIDALGLAPALLVGHSFAARIVLQAAADRPDLAAGVLLLDGSRSVGGFAASEAPAEEPPPMQASLAEILDSTIGPYADHATRARLQAQMSATPTDVMRASVAALQEWDEDSADAVVAALPPDLPLLAVQSTYHDRFTPRRSLEEDAAGTPYLDYLKTIRPDIEVAILPHTGHFAMLERPAEVTALIRAFAARTMGETAWHA